MNSSRQADAMQCSALRRNPAQRSDKQTTSKTRLCRIPKSPRDRDHDGGNVHNDAKSRSIAISSLVIALLPFTLIQRTRRTSKFHDGTTQQPPAMSVSNQRHSPWRERAITFVVVYVLFYAQHLMELSNGVWISSLSSWTPDWPSDFLSIRTDQEPCNDTVGTLALPHCNSSLSSTTIPTAQTVAGPRYLVAFTSLGTPSAIATVHYNVMHHFANRSEWSCQVFLYVNETYIPDDEPRIAEIRSYCSIVRIPNTNWAHFLLTLSPAVVGSFDKIAVVLDDVFLPAVGPYPVRVPSLLEAMDRYNLSTISPHVKGAYWPSLRGPGSPQNQRCLRRVKHVETFFQIFSRPHWQCFHQYLHHANPQGFCLDLCMDRLCPGLYAVDPNMTSFHLGRQYMIYRFVPKAYLVGANLSYGMRRDFPQGVKDEWGVCDQYSCPKDAKKHSAWSETLVCHDDNGNVVREGGRTTNSKQQTTNN